MLDTELFLRVLYERPPDLRTRFNDEGHDPDECQIDAEIYGAAVLEEK